MSGPSTYEPKTNFTRWLDTRLPILRFVDDTLTTFPTPRNLNFWYSFGGILTFCLGIRFSRASCSRCTMSPLPILPLTASKHHARRELWLAVALHARETAPRCSSSRSTSIFFAAFTTLLQGTARDPVDSGCPHLRADDRDSVPRVHTPWGQMSFWAATVITNLFSSLDQIIPHLGTSIVTWLWGGFGVSDATLEPLLQPALSVAVRHCGGCCSSHLALHVPGNNNPLGIDVKGPQDTVPFIPTTRRRTSSASRSRDPVRADCFYAPDMLGNPDNYTPADPLVTPPDIVPDWYLTPFYAMLRSVRKS